MKRFWPLILCLFCGLFILLVPPLRQLFLTQWRGDGYYRGWAYGPLPQFAYGFDADKFTVEGTTDVRVSVVQAAQGSNATAALDTLIVKHPREAWLIAYRLNLSVSEMQLDRIGGELSDGKLAQHQAAEIPSPERLTTKANFTTAALQKSIALARRGQALEPQNAYFDYLLIYLLIAGWRDEEAFRVLRTASRKPHFNSHAGAWILAQRATQEAYYQAPQSPEASLNLQWNQSLESFPHGKSREMARIVTWQGVKAQRHGQHQKALQILTDYAHLNFVAMDEGYTYIDRLVYQAMANIALSRLGQRDTAAIKRLRNNDPALHEKRARLTATQVQTYANAHGQSALGREMANLSIREGKRNDQLRRISQAQMTFLGLPMRSLIWSIALQRVASLLLLLTMLLLLWWLLIGGALHAAKMPRRMPDAKDVRRAALVAVAATALLWAFSMWGGAGWSFTLMFFRQGANPLLMGAAFLCLPLGFFWPVPLAAWTIKRAARRRHENEQGIVLNGVRARAGAAWQRFHLVSFLQIGAFYMLIALAMLWWIGTMIAPPESTWQQMLGFDGDLPLPQVLDDSVTIFPLWPQLLFASLMALLWLRELLAPDKMRAAYQLRCWHAVLGHLTVATSLSYLLLLMVSVPVRARAAQSVDQYIQRGEVAAMLPSQEVL